MTGCSPTNDPEAANPFVALPIQTWGGPIDLAVGQHAVAALESGKVVVLPQLTFSLVAKEADLLTAELMDQRRKNISFDMKTGQVRGARAETGRLAAMLKRFSIQAESLLRALLVPYSTALIMGRTSFRPAEIEGRTYSPRHDDRRLHVDAFPSRPLQGRRILRIFVNKSPIGQPRTWRVGEPFESLADRFLPQLPPPSSIRARLYAVLGLTKGRLSPYDQMMLALHDQMKLDRKYQTSVLHTPCAFPAETTWMCFTDQVSHAALTGHMAFEQTCYLPVDAMAEPDRSPLRVLERLSGKVLTF